jgi:hypothetical protein
VFKAQNAFQLGPFHHHGHVVLQRAGKGLKPVAENDSPSLYYWYLQDDPTQSLIGLSWIWLGSNAVNVHGDSSLAPIGRGTSPIYVENILQATIYTNSDFGSVKAVEPCTYVAGDVPLAQIAQHKCVWIDSDSRSSTGKPYCFSTTASTLSMEINAELRSMQRQQSHQ